MRIRTVGILGVLLYRVSLFLSKLYLTRHVDVSRLRNLRKGMGEPLDNYTNVVTACRAFIDRKRWNLAHGRVTVSTVGIASKIRQLTKDLPEVCLALSLHAPNQKLRSEIVPTAKHYPIEDMIDALHGHMRGAHNRSSDGRSATRRRAMIEYVMCKWNTRSSGFCFVSRCGVSLSLLSCSTSFCVCDT